MDEQDHQDPFDEDMPMDEKMERKQEQQHIRSLQMRHSTDADSSAASATYRSMTPTKEVSQMVSMMSLSHDGGDPSGIARIIDALNRGSTTRPENLSREERILWDALQTAMVNDRNEHLAKRRALERSLQESTFKLGHITTRETELELELAKAKCECADLEHKYTMALAENRVLVGKVGGKDGKDNPNSEDSDTDKDTEHLTLMAEKLKEKEEQLKQRCKDHDAEVRAIQRVLADLTTEKLKLEERLEEMEQQQAKHGQTAIDTSKSDANGETEICARSFGNEVLSQQIKDLEQEIAASKSHVKSMEGDKKKLQSELDCAKNDSEKLTNEIESLKIKVAGLESEISSEKEQNEHMRVQIADLTTIRDESASNDRKMNPPKPEVDHPKPDGVSDSENDDNDIVSTTNESSFDEVTSLKRELKETSSSLENAKKIIASLEHANGSLAIDQRAKLKSKEEELVMTQKESDERKRRLDSLATELRDLQRRQGDIDETDRRIRSLLLKQKALVGHLQTSISDLQSAIAVHEASMSSETGVVDKSSIEEITEILADALNAMNDILESTEDVLDDADEVSIGNVDVELSSEVGRHIDAIIRNDREAAAKQLRSQLDQKRIAVKRLEEALKKQNEEMKKLRAQLIGSNRGQGESDEQLRAEIQSLRQQCSTNMEVLARKERELSVLRSSLKVDENDAGYISDDASDDEDEGDAGNNALPSPTNIDSYGPADAEALATILSQTTGGIEISGRTHEVQGLKEQLLKALGDKEAASKELQAERESLANAKMIISSLEQANKGMMEDLRSRLQDSNTAIASLLDKSMEHEKNAQIYKQELEQLKLARIDEQKQLKRLQEELSRRNGDDVVNNDNSSADPATAREEKKEEVLAAEL
jgi:chromosome segregation ATPase